MKPPAEPASPLAPAHLDQLAEQRWCLVDGFAGRDEALAARAAAASLDRAGALTPAGLGRGGDHRLNRATRGDRTVWLDDQRPVFGRAAARFERVRIALNRAAFLGLERFDLQLAFYPGDGAHYARHRDAFSGSSNRLITAIWYLNPDWRPAHGGRLRLFVPGEPVVEPTLDRLVVFFSEEVEHAVEPSHGDRWAMTAWMRRPDSTRPLL